MEQWLPFVYTALGIGFVAGVAFLWVIVRFAGWMTRREGKH